MFLAGELWLNPKTIRIALFRGPPGDELRYAHASTTNDGHIGQRWAEFDIDVSTTILIHRGETDYLAGAWPALRHRAVGYRVDRL